MVAGVAVFDVALPQAGKDLRLEVCRLNGTRNPKPETLNPKTRKPETRNLKPENPKSDNSKPDNPKQVCRLNGTACVPDPLRRRNTTAFEVSPPPRTLQ